MIALFAKGTFELLMEYEGVQVARVILLNFFNLRKSLCVFLIKVEMHYIIYNIIYILYYITLKMGNDQPKDL